jgi:predicted CXXCH cytochrome family protein
MRAAITLLLFCAAPAVAAGAPAAPAAAAPYDDAACASCHGAVTARKTLHRPVAEGRGCAACHLPKDGAGKCRGTVSAAWRLAAPDPSLCARCHDVSGRAPMHPAIQALGCGACHEPHGSDNPKLLRRAGAAMCAECHDPVGKKKEVHTALTTGDCLDCHDPHAGEAAPLLKKARRELCFDCHDAAGLFAKRVQHAPVAEGRCAECHDPHASDHPKHLRAERARRAARAPTPRGRRPPPTAGRAASASTSRRRRCTRPWRSRTARSATRPGTAPTTRSSW